MMKTALSFVCNPLQNVCDTTCKSQRSPYFKQVNLIEILHFVTSTKYIHESSPCQKKYLYRQPLNFFYRSKTFGRYSINFSCRLSS